MKKFSFLFLVIFFFTFLGFQNYSIAQNSASCASPSSFTATAGNSSLTISGGTAIKVELEKQDYTWIKICDNNDSNYPSCTGVISVTPEVYRTVKIFDSNWTPCETTTGIEVTSGGGGTVDCSVGIASWSFQNCDNMGTTSTSDDVVQIVLTPSNTASGNFYYVKNSNGNIIEDNIPYGSSFTDPTTYSPGTFVQYFIGNTDSSCSNENTTNSTTPSCSCIDFDNDGVCSDYDCDDNDPNVGECPPTGGSCQQWTGDCNTTGAISRTGKVTVSRLDVTDIIHSKKVYVHLPSDFPDYVFEEEYDLMPLDKLENYIKNNKHLPNIPSAKEVAEKGIDVADLQAKQMEKIEELTLYIIELSKKVEHLEKENKRLQKKRFFRKRK